MIDWFVHWNTLPSAVDDDDVLRQVGKTVGGQPVPASAVDAILSDILAALRLDARDSLLDLCCGNGLVTQRCAVSCRDATGVDFSSPLIRIANNCHSRGNLNYMVADVRSLTSALGDRRYSKVLMYEGLQHLTAEDVERVLEQLRPSSAPHAPVLFGSIPDRDRIWKFYDTADRRQEYHLRVKYGTEAIGYWWTGNELSDIGARWGYRVEIRPQDASLHTSHYRFDALLTPKEAGG